MFRKIEIFIKSERFDGFQSIYEELFSGMAGNLRSLVFTDIFHKILIVIQSQSVNQFRRKLYEEWDTSSLPLYQISICPTE